MYTTQFNAFVWEQEVKILDLPFFYLGKYLNIHIYIHKVSQKIVPMFEEAITPSKIRLETKVDCL